MSDDAEAREKEAGLREALDAADQHLRRGRLDEAEEVYRRILALDQRHFEAMVGLGDAAMARGRPGDALLAYGAAQRQRPDGSARLFMNKGTALAAVAESDAAIACLRRACALEPDNPEILNNLGSVLAEAGQPGEAASCFRRAQSVQPDDARGHFNLGLALEGLAEEAADRRELIAAWLALSATETGPCRVLVQFEACFPGALPHRREHGATGIQYSFRAPELGRKHVSN